MAYQYSHQHHYSNCHFVINHDPAKLKLVTDKEEVRTDIRCSFLACWRPDVSFRVYVSSFNPKP